MYRIQEKARAKTGDAGLSLVSLASSRHYRKCRSRFIIKVLAWGVQTAESGMLLGSRACCRRLASGTANEHHHASDSTGKGGNFGFEKVSSIAQIINHQVWFDARPHHALCCLVALAEQSMRLPPFAQAPSNLPQIQPDGLGST